MTLARTPDGYISTFNIKKGMVLLSKGEWITAESDSTELPYHQFTFDNNTYGYSRNPDSVPKCCNIPLPHTIHHKSNFIKGYNVQNPLTFPLRTTDIKLIQGFIDLTKTIPSINDIGVVIPNADLSYDYENDTINDMVNGILYKVVNLPQYHKDRIVYSRPLKDESMFILHLASIHTTDKEMMKSTYGNLMKIIYSFNPTELMMTVAVKTIIDNYTNEYSLVNTTPTTIYALPHQDIDINNFSTI